MISSRATTRASSVRVLKLMLLGAAGFWLPDTLLHAFAANRHFNLHDLGILILTAAMPLTFLGIFLITKRMQHGTEPRRIGLLMLAGVWLLGGVFMMTDANFLRGGFTTPNDIY